MAHTYTYTTALLPVSQSTYDEVLQKFKAANYVDQIRDDVIDMHGVSLTLDETAKKVPVAWLLAYDNGTAKEAFIAEGLARRALKEIQGFGKSGVILPLYVTP